MPLIWGMDEAGYGPNLGPLVVSLTCWEVPDVEFDFWSKLDGCVSSTGTRDRTRLHVADSKTVHNSSQGLSALELSAWSLLKTAHYSANDLFSLLRDGLELLEAVELNESIAPSYFADCSLPVDADDELITLLTTQLQAGLEHSLTACRGIWANVIWPAEFNRLLEVHGNKSNVLTHISLQLLGSHWRNVSDDPQCVLADRHGGRKFYAGSLQELVGDAAFVTMLIEAKERSRYRIGSTEIEFAEKSERHFPVAAASLVAKYLRELAMLGFNAFWSFHQPGVKPTKGYPKDAKRFMQDIRETVTRLKIPIASIWRER